MDFKHGTSRQGIGLAAGDALCLTCAMRVLV
jgi:hypothetical protein